MQAAKGETEDLPKRLPQGRTIIALCLWAAFARASAAQPDLANASRLWRDGQYQQAFELLASQREAGGTGIAFDLLLAHAMLETNRAEEAKALYESILQTDPGNVDAHLGLGRAYMALGEYVRARQELETVLYIDDLPADLHRQAEIYAEAARKRMQGDDLVTHAHLQFGAGRYSPSGDKSNAFNQWLAGAGLTQALRQGYSLNASVEASHRRDRGIGNTGDYQGRIGLNRAAGKSHYHLELSRRQVRDPDGHVSDHQAINMDWRHHPDADHMLSLGLGLSDAGHDDGLVGQWFRNHRAMTWSAGFEHAFASGAASVSLHALAGREWTRRNGIDGDATFHGLGASFETTLNEHVGVWAGTAWRHNRFQQMRPLDLDEPDTSAHVKRREDLYEVYAGLSWRLPRDWSLQPELLYLRDTGNIPSNRYRSTEFALNLRRDF